MKRYTVLVDKDSYDAEWNSDILGESLRYSLSDGFPRETWYEDGYVSRDDAPARVVYHPDNRDLLIRQEWVLNGRRHRADGPAVIWKSLDGRVVKERYYLNGKLHREGGPAIFERDADTGVVFKEGWYVKGELHREDAPAQTCRDWETGVLETEKWAVNGCYHREGGPAIIERDFKTGEIMQELYYLEGDEVKKEAGPTPPRL